MKTIISLMLSILLLLCLGSCKQKSILQSKPLKEWSTADLYKEYSIQDTVYGTETRVEISNGKRIMNTNALPNHKTGEFPNHANPNTISKQDITYEFPLVPVFTGEAKWTREPGVALNGVKFEPETAERFVCESGETYRVEAIQSLIELGLDFNNAHVQPTGAYHYHGAPTALIDQLNKGEDLVLIGFAHDGFPMYYSKSGKYKASYALVGKSRVGDVCTYNRPHMHKTEKFTGTKPDGTFVSDWEYNEGLGDLDACNGIEINKKYVYIITDSYPYIGRCLNGEYEEKLPKGPPPGLGKRDEHFHSDTHPHPHHEN